MTAQGFDKTQPVEKVSIQYEDIFDVHSPEMDKKLRLRDVRRRGWAGLRESYSHVSRLLDARGPDAPPSEKYLLDEATTNLAAMADMALHALALNMATDPKTLLLKALALSEHLGDPPLANDADDRGPHSPQRRYELVRDLLLDDIIRGLQTVSNTTVGEEGLLSVWSEDKSLLGRIAKADAEVDKALAEMDGPETPTAGQ